MSDFDFKFFPYETFGFAYYKDKCIHCSLTESKTAEQAIEIFHKLRNGFFRDADHPKFIVTYSENEMVEDFLIYFKDYTLEVEISISSCEA